jgi:hypothetical protein
MVSGFRIRPSVWVTGLDNSIKRARGFSASFFSMAFFHIKVNQYARSPVVSEDTNKYYAEK